MKVTLSSFKRFLILNLKDSSFFILHSSFEDSSFEDSSSVETLNPISDDDDDYSKKNRTPTCEEQKRCKYFLFIYNYYI